MTVTLAYAGTSDGYLTSPDASYSAARNGTGTITVNTVQDTLYFGQKLVGTYTHFQSFLQFTYSAIPATSMLTAAVIRTYHAVVNSPSQGRNLEFRQFTWSGSGLTTADFRNEANLAATTLYGYVNYANFATASDTYAGSNELQDLIPTTTTLEFVLVSNRQRQGSVPTIDEATGIYSADRSGTAYDPCLIFTTVARSRANPVMGASVTLNDGTWAYLESTGANPPVVTLKHCLSTGVVSTVATLPIGTGATQFAVPGGTQGLALVVSTSGHFYVLGRVGNAESTLGAIAYVKGAGYTWTAGTFRTAALPYYGGRINQVAAIWHNYTANGRIMAVVGHAPAQGITGTTGNELSWALLDSTYLRNGGSGSLLQGSGSAIGNLTQIISAGTSFNTYANETGSGLDVNTEWLGANPSWGYVASWSKGQLLGSNKSVGLGRYIINSGGTGLSFEDVTEGLAWGVKDAAAKLRVVVINSTSAALVTTDSDTGWGFSYEIRQHSGTTSGSVELGSGALDDEGIATMPSAATLAVSSAWDVVYNSTENRLWIYYVNVSNALQVMRTAISLDTYQPLRNAVVVTTLAAGNVVQAIRVPRNQKVTQKAHVTVASVNAGTLNVSYVLDSFNLAPTEPTLTVRANYDATAAATYTWTFNDPNVGDTQSAYQLQIVNVGTGVTTFDSAKTASATSSRNLTGGTLTNGNNYQWRVKTWDALDVESPWSSYGVFSTSAGGTVTITVPATDNLAGQITDDIQITWSVAGTTQASYRVWLYKTAGNVLVSDTGWLTSTAVTHLVTGMITDTEHRIEVQVRNGALVSSGVGTRLVTPSYGAPEIPVITVSPQTDLGYTLVSVDNPTPQGDRPEVLENQILRRVSGDSDWELIGTTVADGSFKDYTATSGVLYAYKARGVATPGNTDSLETTSTLELQGVWIHDPLDSEDTARSYLYGANARDTSIDAMGTPNYYAGRERPVVDYGEHLSEVVGIAVDIPHGPNYRTELADIQGFARAKRTLIVRDNRGRNIKGAIQSFKMTDAGWGSAVSFAILDSDVSVTVVT